MVRYRVLPSSIATALLCALLLVFSAQAVSAQPGEHSQTRPVPPAAVPAPFSVNASSQSAASSVEFIGADQMKESDKLLAADAESSIAEHARLSYFDLTQGRWSYQQIACRALPNHLFLQYTRNSGTGDVTVFSASVPRNNQGRVRIIPILRRGYSLFSPAPINALTISAFNHIRNEEPAANSASWLGTALCYAALAGRQPKLPSPPDEGSGTKPVVAVTPTMEVSQRGSEVIRFADENAAAKPMEWSMTFTRKGRLIKATHAPAPVISGRPVPQATGDAKTWTVPGAAASQP